MTVAPPGFVAVYFQAKTIDRLDALIDLAQVPPNHDDQAAHDIAESLRVVFWENRTRGRMPKRVVRLP